MPTETLPKLVNIQLKTDEDKELYGELEARVAAETDTAPGELTRPDVFRWAAREALALPDCNHLEEYRMDVGDRTICMRCDGDDRRQERDAEREVAGGL